MEKKLYRSRNDRIISGVCGGVAEYFSVDTTLIRLLWVITVLFAGTGVLAYILCIIIIPEEPMGKLNKKENINSDEDIEETEYSEMKIDETVEKEKMSGNTIVGLAFIFLGLMFFARKILGWFGVTYMWDLFWPAILVFMGLYLILKKKG